MSEESLDDPIRETHGHFDGLLRLVSASAIQVTDRKAQQRLYGAYLGRGPAGTATDERTHPTGSTLVNAEEVAATLQGAAGSDKTAGVGR
ncbi:MAG TPA: hypothetical protein VHB02_08080 [Acidimicrobiales bacterium]|nr:hypothetical protein [Acidimicrobiales bacterium]